MEYHRKPQRESRPQDPHTEQTPDTLVWGKNPVTELLKSGRPVDTVYLADSLPGAAAGYYTALAKQAGAVVKKVPANKLQKICGGAEHQGVAARGAEIEYASLEDLLAAAREKNEPPFLVLCDGIEDPHNLGAILRSALSVSSMAQPASPSSAATLRLTRQSVRHGCRRKAG